MVGMETGSWRGSHVPVTVWFLQPIHGDHNTHGWSAGAEKGAGVGIDCEARHVAESIRCDLLIRAHVGDQILRGLLGQS